MPSRKTGSLVYFDRPSAIDRIFNQLFGFAVRAGLGFEHNFILEVKGRKSGRIFSTPVNVLSYNGRRYLVSSRGETNWVRNARASGRVTLIKGSEREDLVVRELPVADRPIIIKEFLDRFSRSVQRFYPVKKGSPVSAFEGELAERNPVFLLVNP